MVREGGYHPLWPSVPERHAPIHLCSLAVLQPPTGVATREVWALPRSLATTRGIIELFSLPAGTKMFQFPAFAPPDGGGCPSGTRVVPFGDHRINGHVRLPGAYRSLSRPSSPQ